MPTQHDADAWDAAQPHPDQPKRKPWRPTKEVAAADAVIVIRTTRARKGAYVSAAREEGKTLSQWLTDTCDRVCDYVPPAKPPMIV